LNGVLEVLQVAAAPVALDQLLVALAVAGRAADVRREDADAEAAQVLVERLVPRPLLRLRPAVDRQHGRERPLALGPVEPGGDLVAVEAVERDQLDVAEIVLAEAADPALGHGPGVS